MTLADDYLFTNINLYIFFNVHKDKTRRALEMIRTLMLRSTILFMVILYLDTATAKGTPTYFIDILQ